MSPKSAASRTAAAWLLAVAMVCAGSGWGSALARMMSGRPSWSVCGQSLCLCQPLPAQPDCPLCPPGSPGPCESGSSIDPARIALVDTSPGLILGLGHAAEGLIVAVFLASGGREAAAAPRHSAGVIAPANRSTPRSLAADTPTPPPRA